MGKSRIVVKTKDSTFYGILMDSTSTSIIHETLLKIIESKNSSTITIRTLSGKSSIIVDRIDAISIEGV